jgi:hypothetical protein
MIQLYIANKNYSSWSMRPWVLLRQAGIDFEEVYVRFDSFAPDSQFKTSLKDVNPVGKVPVLVHDGWPCGTPWPLPNTWPSSSQTSSSGRKTAPPEHAPAASAPKCTAVLRACAALAR